MNAAGVQAAIERAPLVRAQVTVDIVISHLLPEARTVREADTRVTTRVYLLAASGAGRAKRGGA